jgi:putative membrane-bound dehydrogenase-like protein
MSRLLITLGFALLICLTDAVTSRATQIKLGDRTFTLPDGFTIEQVAGPGVVDRPIVADFDELGRLYVADSSGSSEKVQIQLAQRPHRIVRIEPAGADGKFERSNVFANHMMFPEGVMWYAGSVYVGAPPSIWKLTDIDDSGAATQRFEWLTARTLTGCANDIHGPYLGPDGWIYWCKGAFAEQTYRLPGKKPVVSRAAHIFRCRPDGSGIEPIMTGGMDNPVHVVFTPGGERIFTTTFLQNPANGRRDGIIHAVYGGIYGKVHDVIDDHPHTSPDVMPVLVHLGPAAACGLCRYESDSFGPAYRDNLFATSFNLHKVTRHVLKPDGATFEASNEDFLVCDSVDFHPTDVIEDADGSLVVIDTGGWYKLCCPTSQFAKPDVLGAIYRVKRVGAPQVEDPRGLKIDWTGLDPAGLAKLLDDLRPFVRRRAAHTLGERGAAAIEAIADVLRHSPSPQARLNAVWAATWIEVPNARATARIALHDSDETVRQAAAHSASVWRDRGSFEEMSKLLDRDATHNRRVAAEALGRLGDSRAVPRILEELAKANDRVLDHSLTYALIEIGDKKATAGGLSSDSPRVRRSAMIALDQMEDGGAPVSTIAAALSSDDSALRQTATWIAGRHPEWGQQLAGALADRLGSSQDTEQLADQLSRLARSSSIQAMLADRLIDPKTTVSSRRLILEAMAGAGLNPVPRVWREGLTQLLHSNDERVLSQATTTIGKLQLKRGGDSSLMEALGKVAANQKLSAGVRLSAIAAMPGQLTNVGDEQFRFLLSQLMSEQAVERLLAAQAIARAKLDSAQLSDLAPALKDAGPLEIDPILAAFMQSSDPAVGAKLLESLESARAVTALRADVVGKCLTRFGPDGKDRTAKLIARLNPDASAQQARLDQLLTSLPSGDVRRGQSMFNSAKAACSTCHQIGYVGGHVGPDLTRVGAIRTRRDLLESVVFPSASFVQSFEPTMVITTSGDRQYGIVRRNDASEVMLVTGPNQEVHIARKDVQEMRPGTVSIMPAGFADQLSPQELADLIAFLQACR